MFKIIFLEMFLDDNIRFYLKELKSDISIKKIFKNKKK